MLDSYHACEPATAIAHFKKKNYVFFPSGVHVQLLEAGKQVHCEKMCKQFECGESACGFACDSEQKTKS